MVSLYKRKRWYKVVGGKNQTIKETLHATRERRSQMDCHVISVKIQENRLSKAKLEKLPVIKHIAREKLRYESIYFDPFHGFNSLNNTLEFKVKTEEYDYTNLLKLLNSPEEFCFSADYGNEKGMYKLIGDSYVFHILGKYSNQWYSVAEAFEEFKQKNWR